MCHTGIHADHHIHQLTQGRCVCKVFELIAKVLNARLLERHLVDLPDFVLQTHIRKALRQVRCQLVQCEAAVAVVLVHRTTAPNQANTWLGLATQFGAPSLDLGLVATQVRLW